MKSRYHRVRTQIALKKHFSQPAFTEVILGNLSQDRLKYQTGHDHFHLDISAFAAGFSSFHQQWVRIISAIATQNFSQERQAFGRLLHTWQDFPSHSNYVRIRTKLNPNKVPGEIPPDENETLMHSQRRSGNIYSLTEFSTLLLGILLMLQPRMTAGAEIILADR
jgi:hypothetical protein